MSQQEQQMQNRAETERQYAFMEEAKKLVAMKGAPSFGGIKDVTGALYRAEKEAPYQ